MSDMPSSIADPQRAPAETARPDYDVRRISVADFYRMGEAGLFGPRERIELLDGQLIRMPPIGPRHGYSVDGLALLFFRRFADVAHVRIQGAITLDKWSELLPDVMLNVLPSERYAGAHPKSADALLVVEVAESSLRYDSGRKLRAYARRNVLEYWIVDLVHERIEVHRDPHGEGYRTRLTFERGASVAPSAFPGVEIAVDEVLPPAVR
jgi:Uma2 family endonuclease